MKVFLNLNTAELWLKLYDDLYIVDEYETTFNEVVFVEICDDDSDLLYLGEL